MSVLFSPVVERAVEIAAEWHDGTYRKSRWSEPCAVPPDASPVRVPTMAHVTAVALTVQRAGWDDETVAAAFLHDALEDPNRWGDRLSAEALAALVGPRVVRIVQAVTEPRAADGGALPWRARKEGYLARLAAGPPEAAAVALADKTHNAFTMAQSLACGVDIFTSVPGRRALSAGPEAQAWFLDAAVEATRRHDDPRLGPMREAAEAQAARFREAARRPG